MTFYEKEEAEIKKTKIYREQQGICPVCNRGFDHWGKVQAAHKIIKSKVNLKKYGPEIIHHRLNLVCTHDVCNSSVIVNPETQTGKDLITQIEKEINVENDS